MLHRTQPAGPDATERRAALRTLAGLGLGLALPGAQAYPGPLALKGLPTPELLKYQPVMPPALQELVSASQLPESSFGLHAVPVDGRGQPLVSLNAELPFQLASTTKVVTSLAALDLLGPQYRWRTYAFITAPITDGKLLGDLLIVGGGDASLSTDELRQWFAVLRKQGLQEVWGDIILDRFAFRFQPTDHVGTPEPTPMRPHHALPDAFTLDEGVLRVAVHGRAESAPDITLTPPMEGLRVVNEVRPGRGCTAAVSVEREEGESRVLVRGQWAAGCGSRELAHLALPHEEFTVHAISALWRDCGGKLKGRVLDKRLPDRVAGVPMDAKGKPLAPFSVHQSSALPVVIRDINKTSDNMAARNLLLSLAQGFPQKAATLPDARARLAQWLKRQGLQPGDIEVDNGSGLSRAERGKPRALVQLLRNAWHASQGKTFFDSLPVAGVDGTLANRMNESAAAGRAFLKTGTLADTRALAGYVKSLGGRMYAVVAIINHVDAPHHTAALDAMIDWTVRQG
ncbi:D-alanyl-D-alanine carboxypeptidase, serine-type, PBP4 family [Burkholderiales bacterium JOSHI_001]|nr:D-alanyl-D-alanine carboxypeptidase, serine-type, PBP4 family [Burkholderiales bacterium JOSHI_001]